MLSKLDLLTEAEIDELSSLITHQSIKFLNTFPEIVSKIGGTFLPFRKEVVSKSHELLKVGSVNLSFPILVGGEMRFATPDGTPIGKGWLVNPNKVVEPGWIFVPGVAFDKNGRRLGRGRGFYDRYLSDRKIIKIGVCASLQLVDEVPVEKHDSLMDFLITEKDCWDVAQQMRF